MPAMMMRLLLSVRELGCVWGGEEHRMGSSFLYFGSNYQPTNGRSNSDLKRSSSKRLHQQSNIAQSFQHLFKFLLFVPRTYPLRQYFLLPTPPPTNPPLHPTHIAKPLPTPTRHMITSTPPLHQILTPRTLLPPLPSGQCSRSLRVDVCDTLRAWVRETAAMAACGCSAGGAEHGVCGKGVRRLA